MMNHSHEKDLCDMQPTQLGISQTPLHWILEGAAKTTSKQSRSHVTRPNSEISEIWHTLFTPLRPPCDLLYCAVWNLTDGFFANRKSNFNQNPKQQPAQSQNQTASTTTKSWTCHCYQFVEIQLICYLAYNEKFNPNQTETFQQYAPFSTIKIWNNVIS